MTKQKPLAEFLAEDEDGIIPKPERIKRQCLRCDAKFTAVSRVNRICAKCKTLQIWHSCTHVYGPPKSRKGKAEQGVE